LGTGDTRCSIEGYQHRRTREGVEAWHWRLHSSKSSVMISKNMQILSWTKLDVAVKKK